MINYALQLITSCEIFSNVNQAAFPDKVKMFNVLGATDFCCHPDL